MKTKTPIVGWLVFAALVAAVATVAVAQPTAWQFTETRYCGPPQRDADGRIIRSRAVLAAFQRLHPCPATGKTTGSCEGWAINHTLPLSCGGCDAVSNLDWMPVEIKSCSDPWCRDRWERKVYNNAGLADSRACQNEVVTWPR